MVEPVVVPWEAVEEPWANQEPRPPQEARNLKAFNIFSAQTPTTMPRVLPPAQEPLSSEEETVFNS